MNAPARITAPAWARYLPLVAELAPGSSDEQAELRARLMLLRDLANSEQRDCSWEAGQALTAIENIAAAHMLTEMPVEMLAATRLALLRFYRAARDLEAVFGEQMNDRQAHGGG